jgi:membrane-associated protein
MIENVMYMLLHVDTYLNTIVSTYGTWVYGILFMIIFCETGLVVTPFLPGDSLIFMAGSLAGYQAVMHVSWLWVILIGASILGNQLNYSIGRLIGDRAFKMKDGFLLRKTHLMKTHAFYMEYGGMTIVIARFMPIIRTFAPFIAGVGRMPHTTFLYYNVIGAVLWITSLLFAGYYLGGIPFLQAHFSLVIYGIIVLSLLPMVIGIVRHQLSRLCKS